MCILKHPENGMDFLFKGNKKRQKRQLKCISIAVVFLSQVEPQRHKSTVKAKKKKDIKYTKKVVSVHFS